MARDHRSDAASCDDFVSNGCAKRFSALKLKVVERIIWAWILTIPVTAGLSFVLVWGLAKVGIISP